MKLTEYRVTKFRSVDDSEWIKTGAVTAFIGENETGKTNLLLPLWKLNPAGSGGEIDPLADMPRSSYHAMRGKAADTTFVYADFATSPELIGEIFLLCCWMRMSQVESEQSLCAKISMPARTIGFSPSGTL